MRAALAVLVCCLPISLSLWLLVRDGRGRYAVETAAFAASGTWALRVVVRWKGRQTVAAVFPLQIGEGVR